MNEKKEYTGFHLKSVRMGIFLISLLLAMMVLVPMVNAVELNKNNGSVVYGKNITLNINFPKEEEAVYADVIGSPVSIYADIDSPEGIKEVWITNGINQNLCRADSGHRFFCQNPWHEGRNTIKITAYDNSGNEVSQMRNYTLFIGQQPPTTVIPSPQNRSLPGFGFLSGICSVLIGLSIITIIKR